MNIDLIMSEWEGADLDAKIARIFFLNLMQTIEHDTKLAAVIGEKIRCERTSDGREVILARFPGMLNSSDEVIINTRMQGGWSLGISTWRARKRDIKLNEFCTKILLSNGTKRKSEAWKLFCLCNDCAFPCL